MIINMHVGFWRKQEFVCVSGSEAKYCRKLRSPVKPQHQSYFLSFLFTIIIIIWTYLMAHLVPLMQILNSFTLNIEYTGEQLIIFCDH